ncbi:protein Skeletor, isoforms B/C-like [Dermacentor variabilis]|uniref:protein Skeletor, isoforms B/C-like n=1 Tax=Dermacentor variabilis TaxID=34621 RepID=UPI003F5B0540
MCPCTALHTTLGRVDVPADLDYPKPAKVATRIGSEHIFVESVVVEDRKTIGLNRFFYDASAPDAYFVAVKENDPISQGIVIQREGERLREHVDENLRLTLPGNLTVDDIDWFSVYCFSCSKPLIAVRIPKGLNVPVDTKWLKKRSRQVEARVKQAPTDPTQFANCETIIADTIQVAWHLEADAITFHVRAKAMPGMWTAFGISGKADGSMMVGADVAVLFISKANSKVSVVDYYITGKAQCSGTDGVCPDDKQGGKEDLTVASLRYANGVVDAVYSRKLNTGDSKDKPIPATGPQAVVAAQGPTDEKAPDTVLYHTKIYTDKTVSVILQFDRAPKRNCPPISQHQVPPPDPRRKLFGGRDLFKKYNIDTFTARIGPTGGDRGYAAITGANAPATSLGPQASLPPSSPKKALLVQRHLQR